MKTPTKTPMPNVTEPCIQSVHKSWQAKQATDSICLQVSEYRDFRPNIHTHTHTGAYVYVRTWTCWQYQTSLHARYRKLKLGLSLALNPFSCLVMASVVTHFKAFFRKQYELLPCYYCTAHGGSSYSQAAQPAL